jgi:hypothetical protein
MELKSLIQFLWVAGILCQAVLGVALVLKGSWRKFPFFTTYVTVGLSESLFIYAFQQHKAIYFYSYWLMELLGIILGFAVVYEIFQSLFAEHNGLRRLATLTFRFALILLLAVGFIVLIRHSSVGFKSVMTAVVVVEESARIIEVGALVCLFLLSSAFGLHWRNQVFGIALGLGIFAAIELITVTVWGQTGKEVHDALNVIRILSFNISLLIWIGYLLAPERAPSEMELPQRSQLEQWNQAVMELIRQ